MTTVIKDIQQALEEQDIEKVYECYHQFFDYLDPKKDFSTLIDLGAYSVSIGFKTALNTFSPGFSIGPGGNPL